MLYKVVKEEGVVVDGIEFAKGEVIDLEPTAFNIPQLLSEGSVVESSVEKEESGDTGTDSEEEEEESEEEEEEGGDDSDEGEGVAA